MQNPDGGWGELEDQSRCSSSAVQTAWALMGLSACKTDHSNATWHRASQRGIRYLLSTQNHQHGLWDEPRHLGIVFEKTVNFRYEFYPAYFPMIALREHLEAFDNSHPSPFNSQTLT
jgi:squalene-hopene/tetraprenyl-beta-curcumene cyclase